MYAIMGATGHIGSRITDALLAQGKQVRVIRRDAAKLADFAKRGAQIAAGDANDAAFLTEAFSGAQAVFAMIPPNYGEADMLQGQAALGESIVRAIAASGVKRVVNLSSVGAGLPAGTGPIRTLHAQEQRLAQLQGIDVLHLRPAYFMENLLHAVPVIRATGKQFDMIAADAPMRMIATQDIAAYAVKALLGAQPRGHAVQHLVGPRTVTMREASRILGAAIGVPNVEYVQVTVDQARPNMQAAGFSEQAILLFAEMAQAMSDGRINATFTPTPADTTTTTLEAFVAAAAGGH